MQLTLKYNEHASHVLSGAFIRGNTPGIWLQEMTAWNIPLEKLVCFIISQNNNPVDAAGLFVIFTREQLPAILQVRHPYTVLGGKLYIPVNGELAPAISEQELQSLLIWDYQAFHPTIGFIGFERSDRIELADLFQYREPRNIYWGNAHAGNAPWIPLHLIGIQRLTAEEVFESIKEHISNKPLEEIPKANQSEVPSWLNNPIARGLFKGVFSIISGLSSIIPAGLFALGRRSAGSSSGSATGDKRPGLFKQILNWMEQKIEELEKQRDSELKRLSDLFEKNMDEALQYAIPLSSPYLSRGTAKPSAQLTRRSLKFNLGRFGGGQAVDGWNVDNYYDDLRNKYLKAAEKAIEENDYKKAAYVYAHLLGDYTSAAATLRKGKHYREAAVLYKDHMNNLPMAAACLEEGGLLTEAIEIYTGLNQHEKAGDLYLMLDQKEPALTCYEKCVVAAAANKDYLEQSRIIIDKIGDQPRAKKILLNGWEDIKQPEACLTKYFDLVAGENNEQLPAAVKALYANTELTNKGMPFLNVIDKVNQKYKTTELENTCQGIAYEIVSEQVNAGNPASLHALKNFVPGDQLLAPDCFRFIHTFKDAPEQKPAPNVFQLLKEVRWQKAQTWKNQLLVWGLTSSGLILARMNWDGHIEYFNWNVLLKPSSLLLPMVDPQSTNHIILYDYNESFTEKCLPGNRYFQEELIVSHPGFLPSKVVGVCMHQGEIIVFHRGMEPVDIYMTSYSLKGEELRSLRCKYNGDVFIIPSTFASEMIWCDNNYYLACDTLLLRISEEGAIDLLYQVKEPILSVAVSKRNDGWVTIVFFYNCVVKLITYDRSEYHTDPYEVKGVDVNDMTFLPDSRFVMAGSDVQVVDLRDYTSPELQWHLETKNEVIAVFPGPARDQIGVLESNGQITLHNISESE